MLKTARLTANGFTMVELLVVVSIIAIMTGALIPSFSAYTKNQELRQGQEQIINDLYNIQNNAMTGKKGNNPSAVTSHWGLKLFAGSSQYVTLTKGTSQTFASVCTTPGPNTERTYSLGEGIISPSNTCVFFSLGNGDATLAGDTTAVFVKRDTGTGCFKVDVNSAGLIKRIAGVQTCP